MLIANALQKNLLRTWNGSLFILPSSYLGAVTILFLKIHHPLDQPVEEGSAWTDMTLGAVIVIPSVQQASIISQPDPSPPTDWESKYPNVT